MDTAGINAHICVEKLMEEETLKAKTCIMTISFVQILESILELLNYTDPTQV